MKRFSKRLSAIMLSETLRNLYVSRIYRGMLSIEYLWCNIWRTTQNNSDALHFVALLLERLFFITFYLTYDA